MNNNIVIWGTGSVGALAGFYYKESCNIICYIDNDSRKWGKLLNGIKICSPDIIKDINAEVILALKGGADSVRKQLDEKYGIKDSVWFQINTKVYSMEKHNNEIAEDTCIVALSGGLGNQMFQYAFIKNLQNQRKKVLGDLSLNIGMTDSVLLSTFKSIELEICTEEQKENLIKENMQIGQRQKKFIIYKEKNNNEGIEKRTDLSILDASGGIFFGIFQTYLFAERVKNLLLNDFKFRTDSDSGFKKIFRLFSNKNLVAVHIRRGDYLEGNNPWIYGDICTEEYYMKAIKYIKERIGKCDFAFFSNDIDWVKKHYLLEDAIYVEKNMFDNYQDWYDMCLMSYCNHNIIANSTFSWWAAWLNQNQNKIVIAPKKWVNLCNYIDIYPKEWIQI